jgi:hypothetical protein
MKKHLQNQKPELFLMDLIVLVFLFIFPLKAQNQTFIVKGNISGSKHPHFKSFGNPRR